MIRALYTARTESYGARKMRYKEGTIKRLMSFLRWICEYCRVAKTDSLRQYWRQFKMLFDRINGFRIDSNDARDAVRVRSPYSMDEKGGYAKVVL